MTATTSAATSGVEEDAMRLLGAFYDLSGGKLNEPVPIGDSQTPGENGAAHKAGMEPGAWETSIALRYLLNTGKVQNADTAGAYRITVPGMDVVRRARGLDPPPKKVRHLSDKAQRRLLTVLAIMLASFFKRPFTGLLVRQIPERRGVKDDLAEAAVEALSRTAALAVASVVIRKLAGR